MKITYLLHCNSHNFMVFQNSCILRNYMISKTYQTSELHQYGIATLCKKWRKINVPVAESENFYKVL